MKLLVVTPYFYPKIGGLENYAYNISKGLKEKYGWEVVVITSNHEEKKYIEENIDGMKIYRLAPWFKISNTPINPFWYFQIKKIIRKEKPNIVNAHTPVPFIADITALVCGKIPLFVTYHAFTLYKYNSIFFNLIIKIYKLFEYLLFVKADKIVIVSEVIKENIPNRFKRKIVIINNTISITDIPEQKKSNMDNSKNIIFIGSLDKTHAWKGLNELLIAIKLYRVKTKKNINLFIIGDGDNKHNYQKRAKDYGIRKNVKFFGKKESKAKHEILDDATIGVIYPKSSNDAFPTVMLEYWAHSLPIIASNIEPINKIIKDKKTAYLVNPKDPKALAEAIKYLINNKALVNKISIGGYKELREKYILENEIKKFYSVVKSYAI